MAKIRKVKRGFKALAVTIGLIVIVGLGSFFYYRTSLQATGAGTVEFTVESGESVSSVLNRLEAENLISSASMARIYIKLNSGVALKAGTYDLSGEMDTAEILSVLSDSSKAHSNDIRVTIIEGEWCKHIAEKLEEALGIEARELLALWNDEAYIRSLMSEYPFLTEEIFDEDIRYYLEGYLMPNTYNFSPDSSADEITRRFLDQMLKVYNRHKEAIEASELSVHELFTLASIVQYESGKAEEMKLIAGVFYNRMQISMALQSSVTVCYAIDMEKDDDWKNCETNPTYDSPYNTYLVQGLPPGPILNFGEDALEAVLNPTASDYLYFLADVYGDGTVYYAKTYEEHLANKRKYLE